MATILVVDDEPKITQLVRDYLERAGFGVVTAGDGREALMRARTEHPDLVVLDLGLPQLDGLDVTRRLRREADVPIIMLTARDDETDKLIGLELGADDHVSRTRSAPSSARRSHVAGVRGEERIPLEARREERAEQRIDPVWSGPDTPEIAVRSMREALIEVIRTARHRLTVVSFAAYKVQAVVSELVAAADRGVDVRLVLETTEDSAGYLKLDAAAAFVALKGRATFWIWPGDRRPANAKLHAKAAIADGHAGLVGSANLTEVALGDSMELGVLVTGGSIPRRLDGHFMALMERGDLRSE